MHMAGTLLCFLLTNMKSKDIGTRNKHNCLKFRFDQYAALNIYKTHNLQISTKKTPLLKILEWTFPLFNLDSPIYYFQGYMYLNNLFTRK